MTSTPLVPQLFEFAGLSLSAVLVSIPDTDGEPWFNGKDAATMLGYRKFHEAIRLNVSYANKQTLLVRTRGGPQKIVYINEAGLYQLIMDSRLPAARAFRDWVTDVVLPSIRKHGGYIDPKANREQLETLHRRIVRQLGIGDIRSMSLPQLKRELEIRTKLDDFDDVKFALRMRHDELDQEERARERASIDYESLAYERSNVMLHRAAGAAAADWWVVTPNDSIPVRPCTEEERKRLRLPPPTLELQGQPGNVPTAV